MNGQAVADPPLKLELLHATVNGSTLTAFREQPSHEWRISFEGLDPFGTVKASATPEQVKAAMLRFLVGIE